MLPEFLTERVNKALKKEKVTGKNQNEIMKRIEQTYEDAKISPGEAIGVITAESFGEPSTQMSISFNEKVIVKIKNRIKIIEIGKLVDKLINKMGSYKINEHTEVLPLDDFEILVPSINHGEKIEWKKVFELSRHKSPSKLMKIITASGRKITATDNHSFVTRANNAVVPIVGKNLKMGDRIPSIKYLPEHCASVISVSEYIELPSTPRTW